MELPRRSANFALIASMLGSGRRALALNQTAGKKQQTTFVTCTHSAQSSYCAWWIKGSELCAKAFDSPLVVVQDEGSFGDSTLAQIDAVAAKANYDIVLNVDAPHDPVFLAKLRDFCVQKKIFFVTQNNLACQILPPWQSDPYYVAHIDFDQRMAGVRTGKQLISAMGGSGGIVALTAWPADRSSTLRFSGLQSAVALAPKCRLLEGPANAEWEISVAYDVCRGLIAKYGHQIKGIWAANDDMALGAIEAVRVYQRTIPVTGMDGLRSGIDAVQAGSLTATIAWDSFWQGGVGLAIAYFARTGLIVPASLPHLHRTFYGALSMVTADNVLEFEEYRDSDKPAVNWNDLWGRNAGEIPQA